MLYEVFCMVLQNIDTELLQPRMYKFGSVNQAKYTEAPDCWASRLIDGVLGNTNEKIY